MNKAELVESIKDIGAYESKAAAGRALDFVLEAIKKGVKKDGDVRLIGFGTFEMVKRKKRKGRNPRTGEAITIKASKSVKFKVGADFKASVK
jgi:DNA-binding protein HU-beta